MENSYKRNKKNGSNAIINYFLKVLSSQKNCRMAEPGEFTKLAFQNNKIDLLKAESIGDLKVMADTIVSIENAREYFSRKLIINLTSQNISPDEIEDLYEFARKYPGECSLIFHLPNPNTQIPKPISVLAHNIKVSTNKIFIKQLREKYGKENIRVE